MSKTFCPWDDSGKLLPNITVRQYAQFVHDNGNSANFTIDGVYYNLHNLLIAPPNGVDMDAIVISSDSGYYGTPGVRTK